MTTPIAMDTSTRWHARASSIKETVDQLSRIWVNAAQEAEGERVPDHERAEARADPRLGAWMDRAEPEVRVRMRTSVLTLVVIAERPETADRAMAIVNALAARHPSRAIVLSPGDPDGPRTFDAHIYAACRLASHTGTEVCTEEILVKTGGELSGHLATVVAPLLIHDLPVVLWWPDDPPFRSRRFLDLVETCDGLLVDSGDFRGSGAQGLHGMAATLREGKPVHDIGWMRLSLWRELFAGIFDHPLLLPELPSCRRLRIDVSRPGSELRVARAALFCGWLAAALGWSVDRPLVPDEATGSLHGVFKHRKQTIPVELRPIVGSSRSLHAGSLVRVEMELVERRATTKARVTRQADHLLATADWNGAQVMRRAGTLEPFEETPFLAEALDRTAPDPAFERALGRAVELVGT